jgi:S1-C subfamily serine protease
VTLARRRPTVVALTLALFLALPVIGTTTDAAVAAGPGPAALVAEPSRPVAGPASGLLNLLSDLLAQLLPTPLPAGFGPPPALASRVTASTVRVNGTACGLRLAGSGFSLAPDTVVTNAHVVAGTTNTSVLRPDGRTLPAQVQVFDPNRDLAVLSVPGLGEAPLEVASAAAGETDAVFGHPRGQAPVDVEPAVVARRVTADIGDIYDRAAAVRQILVLNANLAPGDSGAPLVNGAGKVVGVAFGVASLRRSIAFAVASEEIAPVLAQPRTGPVSTGPCLP